ncbi:MAG: DUF1385 domain-containing protein [Ruminococcus sp.]|uniref:DUF1385 domain-containing protein n=1 Tax=Ruminococcus sp. TaxID=41978 RepID=UPI0028732DDA|nr:DUF1385 domain-containing protein [Ruminococcus sp.]MBQ3285262.1 DUF1385 domain-containing protein [Ruminococcus sp.]
MKKQKDKQKRITSIGGSALIEGIMMRGPKRTTVACRVNEDTIYTEDIEVKPLFKAKFWKLPIVRGIAGMIDSMRLSYKALGLSADKAMEAGLVEEEEPSKFEKWLDDKFGDKLMNVIMVIATILGVALAVGLFIVLPSMLFTWLIKPLITDWTEEPTRLLQSAFEGVLKLILFFSYMLLVSQTKDIKRVFKYHGAEHKTIFCYENEEELTVENVRKQIRFHPRCGTSFLVVTLIVGIVVGLFIPTFPNMPVLRPLLRLLLLPIMVGLGYECIKLCGKYDNVFTHILATPGLWAQRITTKEPDDEMIECAIEAMKAVIPDDGSDIVNDCSCAS